MKNVTVRRLRSNYKNFDEFEVYSKIYGLHKRLGYMTPESAWKHNPRIQQSVDPRDYKKVRSPKKKN